MAQDLIRVRIADALGYVASANAYITFDPAVDTVDDLLSAVSTWLSNVQHCSGGRIVEAQLKLEVDVSGFAGMPIEVGARVDSGLVLKFASNDLDALPWDFLVPAVSTSVVSGGAPDMTEGATIDVLADMMENLGTGPSGFAFVTNRGGKLGPTAGGFLATGKRSRQLSTLSVRVSE